MRSSGCAIGGRRRRIRAEGVVPLPPPTHPPFCPHHTDRGRGEGGGENKNTGTKTGKQTERDRGTQGERGKKQQ